MREDAVFNVIAHMIRRKMLFVTALMLVALAGIVMAHGWSWASLTVVMVSMIALPIIWALSAFWIWAFRNIGQRRGGS
jgi:hypothetical protein